MRVLGFGFGAVRHRRTLQLFCRFGPGDDVTALIWRNCYVEKMILTSVGVHVTLRRFTSSDDGAEGASREHEGADPESSRDAKIGSHGQARV